MVKKATLDDYRSTTKNSLFGSSDDDEFPDAENNEALVKESVYISINRSYPGVPAWVTEVKSVNETDYLNMFVDADTNAQVACDIARKYEDGGLPCGVNQIAALTWYKFAAETGSAEAAAHLVLIETDTNNLK